MFSELGVDAEKVVKLSNWMENQRKDGKNEGASGGRFTYQFTPTTLGMVIKVVDNITKEEFDVSDYENW